MDPRYYLCQAAGIILILGTLWLLSKKKVYLDAKTKQVTKIQFPLPFAVKLTTNAHVIVIFLFGIVLMILPLLITESLPSVQVKGTISSSDHPVYIYAVIRTEIVEQDGGFTISMPQDLGSGYTPKILYVVKSSENIFSDFVQTTQAKRGVISLTTKQINFTSLTPRLLADAKPVPDNFKH